MAREAKIEAAAIGSLDGAAAIGSCNVCVAKVLSGKEEKGAEAQAQGLRKLNGAKIWSCCTCSW